MRILVAFFLILTLWQTTATAQEVWKIAGWRVDRNAAIAGQNGDTIDGIGVNFPKQEDVARFVICSSSQALRNDPYVDVRGVIGRDDSEDSFFGRLNRVKGSPYCWRGSLDSSTLSNIKRGRVLVLAIDKAVVMLVDLEGSSDAMNQAWQNTLEMRYSDALKKQENAIRSYILRGLLEDM